MSGDGLCSWCLSSHPVVLSVVAATVMTLGLPLGILRVVACSTLALREKSAARCSRWSEDLGSLSFASVRTS